jgi:tetratricopeptide (TPR) repeat protein
MFEHADDSSGVLASFSGIKLPLSEEARASLAAVRAAQEAARLRARRETVKTRLWFAAIVGAITVTVIVLGPRSRRGPTGASSRPTASANPAATTIAASGTAPRTGMAAALAARPSETRPVPAAVASAPGNAPTPTPPIAPALNQTGASPAVPAAPSAGDAAASEQLVAACADDFRQRRWRLSIEACTAAFTARPKDAGLALEVAKSYYAHARGVEAGQWASRAIALDPTLAEAFVLVARAHGKAGQTAGAVEAYRRYLALAPRGWHAPEARAAVHARRRDEHAARLPPPGRPSRAAASPLEPPAPAAAAEEEAAAPRPLPERTGG